MTCPNADKWNLLSMDLLSEAEGAELFAHARTCEVCRAALGHARRDHTSLLRAFEVFDQNHDELRNELLATRPVHFLRPRPRLARAWQGMGGLLMNLNTTPRRVAAVLAPAACILIAVGLFLVHGQGGVAFAAVLERMRQARTMVCDTVMTTRTEFSETDAKKVERTQQEEGATPVPTVQTTCGKLSMYCDGTTQAWRMDQTDPPSTQWTFPDHSVNIDAEGKRTVIRFAEHPNPYERCETPEWWLDRLLKLTEAPDRELGTETLDGREVVGFEIAGWKLGYGARPAPDRDELTDATSVVHLWVDAGTRLPVRMHVEDLMNAQLPGVCSMRASMTWDHIEWDVPLDPQSFQPPPPVAGEPVEQRESGIPVPTEEVLLDGLRAYAERIKTLLPEGFADHLPQLMEQMEQEWPDDPKAAQARAVLGDILEVLGRHGYPPQLDGSSLASSMLKLSIVAPSLERGPELAARIRGDAEALARWAEEREAAAGNAEAAARLAERREAARKKLDKKLEELTPSVLAMMVFYHQLLLEDREPEYFGATVKPGDADAVLMRWKHDDQHVRVIYGDLRVETVRIEE